MTSPSDYQMVPLHAIPRSSRRVQVAAVAQCIGHARDDAEARRFVEMLFGPVGRCRRCGAEFTQNLPDGEARLCGRCRRLAHRSNGHRLRAGQLAGRTGDGGRDAADFEALFQAEDDQMMAEIAAHRDVR